MLAVPNNQGCYKGLEEEESTSIIGLVRVVCLLIRQEHLYPGLEQLIYCNKRDICMLTKSRLGYSLDLDKR